MNLPGSTLTFSPAERARVEAIEAMGRRGASAVDTLIPALEDPSWAVRRSVISTLARLGDAAVDALCRVLRSPRTSEVALAAAVETLVASTGDVDRRVLELAADANPAIVADAASILGRRQSSRAAPVLAGLTTHADDNVAVAAIEALGRIQGTTALDALINVAASKNFFRCLPAIDVLGRGGDARAVNPLIALLGEPFFGHEAARALGRIGDVGAIESLTRLLQPSNDTLVRASAVALAEIDDRQRARFGISDAVPTIVAGSLPDPFAARTAARNVRESLAGSEPLEKAALCRVLGWLGGDEAVATLIELLGAAPDVARAATEALARIDHRADRALLVALRTGNSAQRLRLLPLVGARSSSVGDIALCLHDHDADVRVRACGILGGNGDPAAVPALFALLDDSDPRVAQAAVGAIQSLGSDETERLSIETAQTGSPRSRRAALRVIAYFGYPRALATLLAASEDNDDKIRDAAIYALAFVEDPRALDALMAAAVHPTAKIRASAMRALGHTAPKPSTSERLVQGLADPQAWVRYYSCQALGRLRDNVAVEAIAALLDDPAPQVRVAVVEALSLLEGERAAAALRAAAVSSDGDVQRAAFLGIALARLHSAIPLLLAGVESDDTATRIVALSALAQFDHPDAARALFRAATKGDETTRNAAFGFLATRGGLAATAGLADLLDVPALRDAAVGGLSLPAPGRIGGILFALETADEDRSRWLIAALTRMNRADARAAVSVALGFDSVPPRRAAIAALTALRTNEARAALERAAETDPDPALRRLAALGLAR